MIKNLVLDKLKQSTDYISGQELSEILNVSRTSIWKAVKSLREEGYIIKAVTNKGYLLENKDFVLLCNYEIKKRLNTIFLGRKITILDTVTSTNEYIKNSIKDNGTVVISKKQTDGKAKNKNEFNSLKDGIYMSVLYIPKNLVISDLLNLKKGIFDSVKLGIVKDKVVNLNDNEIFIGNKKVGGILTQIEIENESEKIEHIIIGIGLYKDCYDNDIQKIENISNILNNLDKFLASIDI